MSAITKYSNYSQLKQVQSSLIQIQQFDKSGHTGQVIGSNGSNGLVWVSTDPISAAWSNFPAVSNVNMDNFSLQNVENIGITGYIQNNSRMTLNFDATTPSINLNNSNFETNIDGQSISIHGANEKIISINGSNSLNLRDDNSSHQITFFPPTDDNYNLACQANGVNSKISLVVTENNPSLFISDQAQTTYSQVTLTSLIYNDGTIETAKLDSTAKTLKLNDGTNNSILSTTNLTFNDIPYSRNIINSTLVYSSAVIYADGHQPATNLAIRNQYAYNGWYFKNSPPAGQKINWYFAPKQPNVTLVSDIKGLAVSFFNAGTTSNDDTLFLTIYTVPTGSGDYAPGFYHSAMTYVFDQATTPIANTAYQGVAICDPSTVPFYYETQVAYNQSTVNNPKGTYLPTQKVLAIVIGTNSASAVNNVEFVVQKLNIIYDTFTQSLALVPP